MTNKDFARAVEDLLMEASETEERFAYDESERGIAIHESAKHEIRGLRRLCQRMGFEAVGHGYFNQYGYLCISNWEVRKRREA